MLRTKTVSIDMFFDTDRVKRAAEADQRSFKLCLGRCQAALHRRFGC
jgi:hypothetical protein